MFFGRRRRHRRHRTIGFMLVIIVAIASSPSTTTPSSSSSSSSSHSSMLFVEATKVAWRGNENILPEHEDAHNAPRSQRYWDEHGIKRPDYAKTDAEIAAERRGGGGGIGIGIGIARLGFALIAASIAVLAIVARADATGRWGDLSNHPLVAPIARFANRMVGALTTGGGGYSRNKSGSSSSHTYRATNVVNEEEAMRMARLARFDNTTRNMLDDMKED
ncbi:hypothetical protein ACHAXA_004885 [Cyclostephanos tholiformis]|uniref:Uncharacterized protein n=1 Tax=Cyclostephanos tholiformis TaxID=382380 RepID=A0ABD3RRX6_9STRA